MKFEIDSKQVLVTGGLGYIGSHTCVQMIQQGMQPVILDNLRNANLEVLNRIEAITEVITTFEKAAGKPIKYEIVARRPGDIAECWSSPEKALKDLNWKAQYSIQDMVNDSWRWQSMNPNGYKS